METVAARCQSRVVRLLRLPDTAISQNLPIRSILTTLMDHVPCYLISDTSPFTGTLANGDW